MSKYLILIVGIVGCLLILYPTEISAVAIRPFLNRAKNASGCGSETAFAGLGCPCNLNGQKCLVDGSRCINKVCQCGPAFLNVTRKADGVKQCLPTFYVIPTVNPAISSVSTGVTVPCNLVPTAAVPGLNLTFINAQKPVYCGSDILYITAETGNNIAVDKDPVLGPGLTYVTIDPNTGEVIPTNPFNAASGAGTFLTETYSGYCIDARGISSNTFSFQLTFPNCNPAG